MTLDTGRQPAGRKSQGAKAGTKGTQQHDFKLMDLVRLSHQCTLGGRRSQAKAEADYEDALATFKAKVRKRGAKIAPDADVNVSIFSAPGCGVYVNPEKVLWYSILERAIGFDWSAALSMLDQVQILADRACDLWPVDISSLPEEPKTWFARWRWRKRLKRLKRAVSAREPHSARAYELDPLFGRDHREAQSQRQPKGQQEPLSGSISCVLEAGEHHPAPSCQCRVRVRSSGSALCAGPVRQRDDCRLRRDC